MKRCGKIQIVDTPKHASPGQEVTVTVKVTNTNAGHKLPTGYGEGRQMWIHIIAEDKNGNPIFEDGWINEEGSLVRVPGITKVYEQKILAEGYNFLAEDDKEFHFVLMNTIEKDNRIPPKGFNKAAYQADGAFIIMKENEYEDGQNWDKTPYTFTIPADTEGKVRVTATLYYQTFSKEYIDFLDSHDLEQTEENGGRARNIPLGSGGRYAGAPENVKGTWGGALKKLWEDVGNGPPVNMGKAKFEIELK
jgi:hypothetical protein